MKTLILYSSKYGTTEKCAKLISNDLEGKTDIVNLINENCDDLSSYETILIGGAIYAGKLQGELKKFVEDNKVQLSDKNVGIFLCCKDEGEKVNEYLNLNFPKEILNKVFIKAHVGHAIDLDKMNFVERFLLKNIFKVKESYSKIDYDAIKRISDKLNEMDRANG